MPKEITIYDLAMEPNSSPATISRGLKRSSTCKKSTINTVFKKAEEMGYEYDFITFRPHRQKFIT